MRYLASLAILCIGCSVSNPRATPNGDTASAQVGEVDRLVDTLKNGDVVWHFQFTGLIPFIEGDSARKLLAYGAEAHPALIGALADPEKFAAAHVLLTKAYKVPILMSGAFWHGLHVTFKADGQVVLYPEQQQILQVYWEHVLGGS